MPTCSLCIELTHPSLFIHLTIVYFDLSFYACGENNCFKNFGKNSFRKHLQKFHNFPVECRDCNEICFFKMFLLVTMKILILIYYYPMRTYKLM